MSEPADPALLEALREVARAREGGGADALVLSNREDGPVVRCGATVVKAHASETDPELLRARIGVVTASELRELFLQPLLDEPLVVRGRLVTVWPLGAPIDPSKPELAPFRETGCLAARLHRVDLRRLATRLPVPPGAAPSRVKEAIVRLAQATDSPERRAIERAFLALLAGWQALGARHTGRAPTLVHGDYHLGQLVWHEGALRLIDIDDVGQGDPAWDLARPASWFATGILSPADWSALVAGYVDAGGPAVDPRDLWASLDLPARAVTVQSAARALANAEREGRALDEMELGWVEVCRDMARDVPG
jgi:aminoglycoside phosphotransferase (APT) family kinase protein